MSQSIPPVVSQVATSFWKSTLGYFTSHLVAAAVGAGIAGVIVGHIL